MSENLRLSEVFWSSSQCFTKTMSHSERIARPHLSAGDREVRCAQFDQGQSEETMFVSIKLAECGFLLHTIFSFLGVMPLFFQWYCVTSIFSVHMSYHSGAPTGAGKIVHGTLRALRRLGRPGNRTVSLCHKMGDRKNILYIPAL